MAEPITPPQPQISTTGPHAAPTPGPQAAAEARSFAASALASERGYPAQKEANLSALDLPKDAQSAGEAASSAAAAATEAGAATREAARQALEGWRSLSDPFYAVRLDLARWIDDFWRQSTTLSPLSLVAAPRGAGAVGLGAAGLPVDLEEAEGAYVLTAELAGVKSDDLTIRVLDGALILSGEKQEQRSRGDGPLRVSERRYGRFERRIELPKDVDREAISAEYLSGVLHVRLPKTQNGGPFERRIEVRSGSPGS